MSKGLLFWIIMIIALIFGLWSQWGNFYFIGNSVVVFVLIGLLGWKVFGPPVT